MHFFFICPVLGAFKEINFFIPWYLSKIRHFMLKRWRLIMSKLSTLSFLFQCHTFFSFLNTNDFSFEISKWVTFFKSVTSNKHLLQKEIKQGMDQKWWNRIQNVKNHKWDVRPSRKESIVNVRLWYPTRKAKHGVAGRAERECSFDNNIEISKNFYF